MRTLLVIIGAWLVLNVFLVVAAINDKLHSWVSYLFSASVIGLVISGAILILRERLRPLSLGSALARCSAPAHPKLTNVAGGVRFPPRTRPLLLPRRTQPSPP
jgi:hypothetical protein